MAQSRRFRPFVNRREAGKLGRKGSSAKADISSNTCDNYSWPHLPGLVAHYRARAWAVNITETYVAWPERAELSWAGRSPEPVPLFPVGGRDFNGASLLPRLLRQLKADGPTGLPLPFGSPPWEKSVATGSPLEKRDSNSWSPATMRQGGSQFVLIRALACGRQAAPGCRPGAVWERPTTELVLI